MVIRTKLLLLIPTLLSLTACKSKDEYYDFKYGIGHRVKVGDFVYRVNSVSNTDHVGEGIIGQSTDGNFAILNMMIRNDGKQEITVTSDLMTYYANERAYEPSKAGMFVPGAYYFNTSMSVKPDETKTFDIIFEIPREIDEDDYLLVKGPLKSKETMQIYMEEDL